MKLTSHQVRTAARLGNQRIIDTADDRDFQRRMRELRRENIRRTAAAS